jgi:hypothetical protein
VALVAQAQAQHVPTIGFPGIAPAETVVPYLVAFLKGLAEAG